MKHQKTMAIDDLNIVPVARLQVINEVTMKYETIENIHYTPAAINKALKRNKLQSAWVYILGNREFWFAGKGNLATR